MLHNPAKFRTFEQSNNTVVPQQTCAHTGAGTQKCVLSIVPVQVKVKNGNKILTTYAFLDPGSSATFCTERLMRQLNMDSIQTHIFLRTMGQAHTVKTHVLTGLEVAGYDDNRFLDLPEVYTQQTMPVTRNNIATEKDLRRWPYLRKIKVPELEVGVDLLIGTNASKLLEPWEIINSCNDGPYAVRTLLGWVVNGPLKGSGSDTGKNGCPTVTVNRISIDKVEQLLITQYNQDFNERSCDDTLISREDMRFHHIMEKTIRLENNHYCVDLPFKDDDVIMPNNRCIAEQRVMSLKRMFQRNKEYHQEYVHFLNDVIKSGYAEQVPQQQLNGTEGKIWYIPHHGVYHPKKKTLRVVFDCGASFKGTSLNSQLLQGPDLTNSLFGVLLRFRQEAVAIMTDVQAMFHQVQVSQKHVDFLRFLWWHNGNVMQPLVDFRMKVHIFGATSSPSCANYALKRVADDNTAHYSDKVLQTIKLNFYVDDCLKSVSSEEEALQMVQDLTAACAKGGFRLSKWMSNSRAVLASIPEENRSKATKELNLDKDNLPVERALGLHWCAETDMFMFKIALENRPCTRRGILSVVNSIYDPLGFLSPFTLPPKLMLQELCKRKIGWDDTIPQTFLQKWTQWLTNLHKLSLLKVERCIKPKNFGKVSNAQLHHFSDASECGYGAVSYLRLKGISDEVNIAFMVGKSRVAPMKQTTIPRLELTAAVLAVRLDKMITKELQLELDQSVFWTDSTTVLNYISSETKRFHTFVANRVAVIREATEVAQWRYIGSKQNPADEASRGLSADDFLKCERWLKGPEFLLTEERTWPKQEVNKPAVSLDDPEVKQDLTVNACVVDDASNTMNKLLTYFSDWEKLKTSVAWFLKFKDLLQQLRKKGKTCNKGHQHKAKINVQPLTRDDLHNAELEIARLCQQQRFHREISLLEKGASSVPTNSDIYRLDPTLQDGLLRVGGRLRKASMPETVKHPIILSKDQYISKLILQHIHKQVGHAGRNHMISTLRKTYWITNANSACRKIIADCVTCRRLQGRVGEQKMSDLPAERLLPDLPPFTNTGVDYFGPIDIKRGRSMVKRYGVIFTCMTSRAVHLEAAHSLTTDSCINAIRRFMCRRGQISNLRSDNGTNFVGAERELREALRALDHNKIQSALAKRGIAWTFNPPAGSHYGGTWERIIRLIRKVLYSIVKQQTMDDESFCTILCEIEAILNSRPITKLSDDPNDLETLTPNHILLLKAKPLLPPGLFDDSDIYIKRRWRQVQYLSDLFWKRWVREYLPLLQERQKWTKPRRNFSVDDVVVIMDPSAPRSSWLMGKVTKTFPDRRGVVRSVQLKTKTGFLERPVTKLCMLLET